MDVSKVARQDLIACIDFHEFMADFLFGLDSVAAENHTVLAMRCRAELKEMEEDNNGKA